jgi:hypothetical protein
MHSIDKAARLMAASIVGAAFMCIGAPVHAETLTPQDYIDIYQLYAKYAWALDTGDGPGRVATFTPDGIFMGNSNNEAPEGMVALAKETTANGNVGDRHLQYNIEIEPTADGAIGKCYVLIVRGKPGRDGGFNASPEMYNDVLVKTADGWRFKKRQVWADASDASPYKARAH